VVQQRHSWDVYAVRIGKRVNVQDLSVIHVTTGRNATIIADDVTIGHRAILHGCTIASFCLVGMGAIVLDRAVIGERSLIGAGALVTEGTVIPPGSLVLGAPAKVRRALTQDEGQEIARSVASYVRLAQRYREMAPP
jgi:carbonic anhydrase/acetyltransferase-like protein (isoleucine patch superfamily)